MHIPMPKISHLQYTVLSLLLKKSQSGKAIRDSLEIYSHKINQPAFCQLMTRMEGRKLIHGHYKCSVVNRQTKRERVYVITAKGVEIQEKTFAFYEIMYKG